MKHLLGKEVGKVRVNKPIVYTDRGYECAAWWEERTSTTGVFPLILKIPPYTYGEDYSVIAQIPGIVTDDYFPGLFGGVLISNEPYVPKNVGQVSRPINVLKTLTEAIRKTGNSPGSDMDFFIQPELWSMYAEQRKIRLREHKEHLERVWADKDPILNYFSQIHHAAEKISKVAKEIEEIEWHENHWFKKDVTPHKQKNWTENTSWAK